MGDITDAVDRASQRSMARRSVPDEPLNYREILDPSRTLEGSLSLGTTREGALQNPAALPVEGDHHEIIDRHRDRNTRYGTSEMVDALTRAARLVAEEYAGAPLRIGNISYPQGGRLPWSNSHHAGRDADLAFYVVDDEGDSVPAPGLIAFDDEGNARDHDLRFDIPRNWALVRALLTDPDIKIHYIFISQGLKDLLLVHALEIEESEEIFTRATRVLHQPTDALPHDDHFHLRIACSDINRLEGCIDWGPHWDWHQWNEAALFARTREVQRAFDDPSPEIRRQAVEYLHRIRSPYGAEIALIYGMEDPADEVREQAFELLTEVRIGSDAGIEKLAEVLEIPELSDENREILYDALRYARSSRAPELAMERYRSTDLEEEERAMALTTLAHRMNPALIPDLLEALESEESPQLRTYLAFYLQRIAARTDGLDWSEEPLTEQHKTALKQWNTWWNQWDQDEPDRTQLLADFTTNLGVDEWKDLHAVDDLIPLLHADDDYVRYNVNRVLARWTGRWTPREWETENHAHRSWTNWWNRNEERLLDDSPRPWEIEEVE